jgi:hypothetical protein
MAVAVDNLRRAFGVVKVPTLGLWYARALVKTGKLVEATERYGEVVRLDVTEGKIKDQKQAQADAAAELEALKPRIPTLWPGRPKVLVCACRPVRQIKST